MHNDSIVKNYMNNTNRWCWLNRVLYNTNVRGREDASLEEVGLGGFPLLRPIVYIQEYGEISRLHYGNCCSYVLYIKRI